MTRFRFLLIAAILLFAGCAPLPPMPEDAVAKRFEPLPDRAVIYLVRHRFDRDFIAPVMLDDEMIGSTYQGTYMRIEVPAGMHQLAGFAADSGRIRFDTKAGQIYFVQHTAHGFRSFNSSGFDLVDAAYGRTLVLNGQMTALITR
jgi:hypothetical protein